MGVGAMYPLPSPYHLSRVSTNLLGRHPTAFALYALTLPSSSPYTGIPYLGQALPRLYPT